MSCQRSVPSSRAGWRPRRRLFLSLLLVAAAALPAVAAPEDPPADRDRAEAATAAGDWAAAATAWEAVVAAAPDDGEAWFQLGTARVRLGEAAAALEAFARAEPEGAPAYLLPLRRSYAEASLGRKAAALDDLEAASRAGLPPGVLSQHPGLAELRTELADEPRFQALLAADERRAHPCAHDAAYAQLDFWVGDWDVVANGNQVGHNVIEKILDGCAVLENWQGGSSGKSFNYRDPASGRWHQLWISSTGNTIAFEGGLDAEGAMRLTGERVEPDGSRVPTRMALIPLSGGRVRQLIEESADGGATWEVGFDAVYQPAATAATDD